MKSAAYFVVWSVVLSVWASCNVSAQTPPPPPGNGQLVVQRRPPGGGGPFWSYGVTPVANQVLGWDGSQIVMVAGGGSGTVWGSITGTLSAQLDLQAALDALQPKAGVLALGGFSSITGTLPAANVGDLSATYLTLAAAGSTYTPLSRSITTQHSLTGGGDLSANRTLSLVNDTATPGNAKYYGTDGGGSRGWYDLPTSAIWGNITGTLSAQTDLQTALNNKAALVHFHVVSGIIHGTANRIFGTSNFGGAGVALSVASPLFHGGSSISMANGNWGDITTSSSGVVWTINNSAVTNAKLANSSITIGGASTALGGTVTASTILDSISNTRGSILYRGASGWAALPPGTSGRALVSNGTGADPSYQAVTSTPGGSSGQLQYNNGGAFGGVSSSSVSGANVTFGGTVAIPNDTVFGRPASSLGFVFKDYVPSAQLQIGLSYIQFTSSALVLGLSGGEVRIISGSGSPESSVTANPGTSFFNTSGGLASTMYVKETGSGNTGWAPAWTVTKTITPGGTTGAQTINKTSGSVNFAAAATSLVVTNSLVTANSIIICTVATNDTTMKSVQAVAGSGSFTIYANTAATAETRVNFIVVN